MSIFGGPPKKNKQQSQKAPGGFFGQKKYRTYKELNWYARKKAPFAKVPGTARKLGKKERAAFMDELKKYAGGSYGLDQRKFNEAIKKMTKERWEAKRKGDFKKEKELKQKITQLDHWNKNANI